MCTVEIWEGSCREVGLGKRMVPVKRKEKDVSGPKVEDQEKGVEVEGHS